MSDHFKEQQVKLYLGIFHYCISPLLLIFMPRAIFPFFPPFLYSRKWRKGSHDNMRQNIRAAISLITATAISQRYVEKILHKVSHSYSQTLCISNSISASTIAQQKQ